VGFLITLSYVYSVSIMEIIKDIGSSPNQLMAVVVTVEISKHGKIQDSV
jgi:hypothetical protein